MLGVYGLYLPKRLSLTITMVTPAVPRFFYADANIAPYLLMSTCFVDRLEVISQTKSC